VGKELTVKLFGNVAEFILKENCPPLPSLKGFWIYKLAPV
jgi:hypothetical protein